MIDPRIKRIARTAKIVLEKTKNPKALSRRQRAAILIEVLGGPVDQEFMKKANAKELGTVFLVSWNKMVDKGDDFSPSALVELRDMIESDESI